MKYSDTAVLRNAGRLAAVLTLITLGLGEANAEKGLVVSAPGKSFAVIDTDTGLVSRPIDVGFKVHDCTISDDGNTAYMSNPSGRSVIPIDLSGPEPVLQTSIPVGIKAEDISLTPDGRFLLVTHDKKEDPLVVIDLASRTVASSTANAGGQSVSVCDNGQALAGSFKDRIYLHRVEANGSLTNLASKAVPDLGRNLSCAKGSQSFVHGSISREGRLTARRVSDLAELSSVDIGGDAGSQAFSPEGDRLYAMSYEHNPKVLAYSYRADTGLIGPLPLWSANTSKHKKLLGVDQIAVATSSGYLYYGEDEDLVIRTPEGALFGRVDTGLTKIAGVCFNRTTVLQPAPVTATILSTVSSSTPVSEGPAGTFQINVQFCNNTANDISNFTQRVAELSNGNSLISRTSDAPSPPPGGPGALQKAARRGTYTDGVLSSGGECLFETNVIGLANRNRFTFFVDFLGTLPPRPPISDDEDDEDDDHHGKKCGFGGSAGPDEGMTRDDYHSQHGSKRCD